MAPAVFVPKMSGQLRICIDYREQKKRTTKDFYPLPFPDEVQDKLKGFSPPLTYTVDSGNYQSTPEIVKRLHFILVQAWGCMSSAECCLGYLEPQFISTSDVHKTTGPAFCHHLRI